MWTWSYILDSDGNAIPEPNIRRWSDWFHIHDRRLAWDVLPNGLIVSTVFLGINHAYDDDNIPILWETMVFTPDHDALDQLRYSSAAAALEGHKLFCEQYAQHKD
jgi:hypothetical protein